MTHDQNKTAADAIPEPSSNAFTAVCARCDEAARAGDFLAQATTARKNALLAAVADALLDHADDIAAANAQDMRRARDAGMDEGRLDRLRFDVERVGASARGVRHVASLPDPIGEVVRGYTVDNGLRLNQIRVPMGVIGMIYEARPNVTVDVASLCMKSGNAAVLYGGHAARLTNAAILDAIREALAAQGADIHTVVSIDEFGRQGADAMMRARGHIDVLIPRGGAQLIQSVVRNATVPVIETGAGNVHIYVERSADQDKAIPIILNAKTQRVGVCNAAEKLIVHRDVARTFLPRVARALAHAGVELHADDASYAIIAADIAGASPGGDQGARRRHECADHEAETGGVELVHATQADWDTEYLSLNMGIKVVDSLDEAVEHINRHSTGHTEAIIAEDYSAVERFTSHIDSAVVMVNASTRFTDGGVFGFGAELGISTQKMHARGPMGLREMTTTKWIVYGTGQVRA